MKRHNQAPLDPDSFDQAVAGKSQGPRIIWTAGAIARRIGTSSDFVRDTLAKEPGTPVRQVGGRYCAVEADLIAFFRRPAA